MKLSHSRKIERKIAHEVAYDTYFPSSGQEVMPLTSPHHFNPRLTPDPHTHSICGLAVGCTAAEMCVSLGILALCSSARMLYSLFYVLLWLLTFLSLVFFRSIITAKRISRPEDVLDHSFCTIIADK